MEIKVFVEGPIDANNYLLIDEKSREAVLIDCSAYDADFIENIKKNRFLLSTIKEAARIIKLSFLLPFFSSVTDHSPTSSL